MIVVSPRMRKWLVEPKLERGRRCPPTLQAPARQPRSGYAVSEGWWDRSQICEVLAGTGISRRGKDGARLWSQTQPQRFGNTERAATGASHTVAPQKWTGMRVARPLFRFGRPACVSQHLCPGKDRDLNEVGGVRFAPHHCVDYFFPAESIIKSSADFARSTRYSSPFGCLVSATRM